MRIDNANRRIILVTLVLLVGIFSFVILALSGQENDKPHLVVQSAELRLAASNTNLVTGLQTIFLLKTWISNDEGFRILSFREIRFLENRSTGIRIINLLKLFQEFHNTLLNPEQCYLSNKGQELPPALS